MRPDLKLIILRFSASSLRPDIERLYIAATRPQGRGHCIVGQKYINVRNVSSDEKTSFEASEWLDSFRSTPAHTLIVYRPPYSEDHPITAGVFLNTSNLSLCPGISYR